MKDGWLKIVMHMINLVSFGNLIKYRSIPSTGKTNFTSKV
jgi:hypothetical protein